MFSVGVVVYFLLLYSLLANYSSTSLPKAAKAGLRPQFARRGWPGLTSAAEPAGDRWSEVTPGTGHWRTAVHCSKHPIDNKCYQMPLSKTLNCAQKVV